MDGRRVTMVSVLVAAVLVSSARAAVLAMPRSPAQVVRAWSKALNAGDDKAAGALFAPGAVAIQGPFGYRLRTTKSAVLWNSGLPCAGKIVRLVVKGKVAVATFRLGHRPGHACDGPGQLAAARFTVAHGKIARWEQVVPGTGVTV